MTDSAGANQSQTSQGQKEEDTLKRMEHALQKIEAARQDIAHSRIDEARRQIKEALKMKKTLWQMEDAHQQIDKDTRQSFLSENLLLNFGSIRWIRRNRWIRWVSLVIVLIGCLIIFGGVAVAYINAELPLSVFVGLFGVLIVFIGTTFLFFYKSTIGQAKGYFEELESKEQGPEERARLKIQYYTHENLRQVRWIFWLSLVAMFLGFFIIIGGAALAYKLASENPNYTQVPSIVTAVTSLSGVIVEFIAATFLIVYRSTMKQASEYVDILRRLNTIGISIRLVDQIVDDPKFKNETWAQIASEILSQPSLEKGDERTRE